ncbi:hypothetical protein A0H81_08230 [Grifola frondosa]|uniref:Cytochrome P450 n=1 Tax=Grifola frondosa TaxID=5627 RepID=A0A1C7M4U3_GRIFR|nr:hypothetical protein A0H81_08230 [Grifola frondosa]
MFAVPRALRHLPHVPVLPTLWSYARWEVEDIRITKLLLPFAKRGEPAVLVYMLGQWIVHVLDHNVIKAITADLDAFPKEVPPDGSLFWHLVGRENVIMNNGAPWKRLSKMVRSALERNVPIDQFVLLARQLFQQMGQGGVLRWDDLTSRYTLDAIGASVLGYDFDAIRSANNPFVSNYKLVFDDLADPAYVAFPILERILPRVDTRRRMGEFVESLQNILNLKRQEPGNDMLTYMLEDKETTDVQLRDNVVTLFIAGHDTTAGALSVRAPKFSPALAADPTGEPTLDALRAMPFLQACIRESLRVNAPILELIPRKAIRDTVVHSGDGTAVAIPAGTSVFVNVHAVHLREDYWAQAAEFNPDRFMEHDTTQWMSFGLGPRQCPARNFAMHEMRTLCAMLLAEWEWTLPDDSPHRDHIKNAFSVVALSLPKDLYIDFKRRAAHGELK